MKKTLTTITLAATLAFGSTFTYAGIIVSDRTGIIVSDKAVPCSEVKDKGFIADIINLIEGIIVSDRSGIIVSDRSNCNTTEGIIVSDRTGIIVSD